MDKFKIHYSDIPIYAKDPKWAEKTKRRSKLTDRAFRQEYELDSWHPMLRSTAGSSRTGLQRECIEAGFIGREYVMAVDPAAGGDDWCSIVMDVTRVPYRVVNVFRMRHKSSDFCIKQIIEQAEDFAPAKVIIEKNGVGAVVSEVLSMKSRSIWSSPTTQTGQTNQQHRPCRLPTRT